MEIGYQTITWRGELQQAFEDIASVGFSSVEMAGLAAVEDESEKVRSLLKKYDLRLIATYFGGNYIEKEDFEYELLRFEEVCRFLQANNSAHIVVGGGMKRPGGNSPADYHVFAQALEEMALRAAIFNLKLCYHPHRNTMVEFPKQIEKIAELTDAEFVSFCFDTGHLASGGGEPAELCRKYSERLAYVHLKDIDSAGRFIELGEGMIDLKGVWTALQETGFDGPLVAELDASNNPKRSCELNKKFLETDLGLTV